MTYTFITFADSLYQIKEQFPDATHEASSNDKILVTIDIKNGSDIAGLFLAGVAYGADRMVAARQSCD